MRVRFVRAFDYTPELASRITVAYPAGWVGTVKRECGEAAIAAGAAVKAWRQRERDKDKNDDNDNNDDNNIDGGGPK